MSEEDKKLQKHLVDEMMKVSKTNPDVMFYMEALMKKYEELEKENNKQKEILDKIKEIINSFMPNEAKLCEALDEISELLEEIE